MNHEAASEKKNRLVTVFKRYSCRRLHFQGTPYEEQTEQASALLKEADMILNGAGASTAAGLAYSGFLSVSHTGGKMGYWSKHSMINRFLRQRGASVGAAL